jgi:hypothetical protein
MSTPEPKSTGHTGQTSDVEARRAADLAIYNNATNPTRTTRAVSWIGWHIGEFAGVVVPLGLAVTVWEGFYAVSGLVALGWAANELRLRGQQITRSDEDGEAR